MSQPTTDCKLGTAIVVSLWHVFIVLSVIIVVLWMLHRIYRVMAGICFILYTLGGLAFSARKRKEWRSAVDAEVAARQKKKLEDQVNALQLGELASCRSLRRRI